VTTVIAGIDLAWTTYRPSGVCLLSIDGEDNVSLLSLECRVDTPAGFVAELLAAGDNVVAAVDAPLIRRDACFAERELAMTFGRYHASAYTAGMDFLERKGLLAGPRLGEALMAAGFELDPLALVPGARGRFAFEMYPHAFHVAAFRLDRRLAYKKGRIAMRREAFAVYQEHLRTLAAAEAPELPGEPRIAEVLAAGALEARGTALKALEDRLDALTCALAALIAWRGGMAPGDVFGERETGYIAVPGLSRDARFVARTGADW
jgi:predicted RNase H-like nuclease